jgi:hypothetical protein
LPKGRIENPIEPGSTDIEEALIKYGNLPFHALTQEEKGLMRRRDLFRVSIRIKNRRV